MSQGKARCSSGCSFDEFRMVEDRAVANRKLLRQLKGRLRRGVTSDAEKLAMMIERLARLGQRSSVEDAVGIAFRIGTLVSILEIEVDRFLTL